MSRGSALFLPAGVWELVRFVATFLVTELLTATTTAARLNLLWVGAPGLLLSGLFFAAAFYPGRAPAYLPLLRIGAALTAITDTGVVLSGSSVLASGMIGLPDAGRRQFVLAFVILVIDLIALAILLAYRTSPRSPHTAQSNGAEPGGDDLPTYDPTNIDTERRP